MTLSAWQFESRLSHAIEVMNDLCVLSLTTLMMLFNDFVPDAIHRYGIGWAFIGIASANILINVFLLVYVPVRQIYEHLRLRKLRKAHEARVLEA